MSKAKALTHTDIITQLTILAEIEAGTYQLDTIEKIAVLLPLLTSEKVSVYTSKRGNLMVRLRKLGQDTLDRNRSWIKSTTWSQSVLKSDTPISSLRLRNEKLHSGTRVLRPAKGRHE